jgi:signal transduction histidine kinase
MHDLDTREAKKDQVSKRNIGILLTIGVIALALAVASYFYITYLAELIRAQAIANLQSTAEADANDVASIAAKQIESVRSNLVLISNAPLVQAQDVQGSLPLFSTAKDLTNEFTFSYFWLDKDGKILWVTTFSNLTTFKQFAGFDNSHRSYYTVPLQTHTFHVSEVILAPDGVKRVIFAYPILDAQDSSFKGVVGASSNLGDVGNLLTGRLVSTESTAMLLAADGTILHSADESMIGMNAFDEQFQSGLPDSSRSEVISFMRRSLDSSISGAAIGGSDNFLNIAADGKSATLAYHAVIVDGRTVAVVFVLAPHTFATDTFTQIENLRILAVILVSSIGGVAFGISTAVIRWNRKLELLILKRTSELAARTKDLEDLNRDLGVANRSLSEAHQELEVHDRLQKEFVNVAAHELRTPVQPLLGAAEIIESQFGNKEKIEVSKAEIEMIVRNARRLERLSSDILEISRIDSGALQLNRETFSLSYIIADAIKDAKIRSRIDPDKVAITYYAGDIFVSADREKIAQVVSNLLINAIKFTQDGTITISTQKDVRTNQAIATITDTGTGIDAEVLPKLFEKFVTKSEHGTGIGLYISKKIVDAHGGRIWGENRTDGIRGATFGFTLPLADSAADMSTSGLLKAGSSAPTTAH